MSASDPTPTTGDDDRDDAVALIEEEAATIDPRSPHAAELINELELDADEMGLPTKAPTEVDVTLPDEG